MLALTVPAALADPHLVLALAGGPFARAVADAVTRHGGAVLGPPVRHRAEEVLPAVDVKVLSLHEGAAQGTASTASPVGGYPAPYSHPTGHWWPTPR